MAARMLGTKSSLFLSTAVFFSTHLTFVSSTLAGDRAIAPQTTATSNKIEDSAAMCSTSYLQIFATTTRELQMVHAYGSMNEMPPNVPDAVALCEKIAKDYPGHVCRVSKDPKNSRRASTSDLENMCRRTAEFATQMRVAPIAKDALIMMEPESVKMLIGDVASMDRLLEKPRSRFVVEGKVMEEVESAMKSSSVRCSFDKHLGHKSADIGPALVVLSAQQSWVGNFRLTAVGFQNTDLVLGCLTDATQPLTTALLQKAFGSIADFISIVNEGSRYELSPQE